MHTYKMQCPCIKAMQNLKYDRFKWNFNELEAVPVFLRAALKAEET